MILQPTIEPHALYLNLHVTVVHFSRLHISYIDGAYARSFFLH